MKIKDAVKISMSIPLYFEAVFIDSIGTIYQKPNNSHKLDIMVDGGITANYPIFLFDTIVEGQRIENPHTLGIKIERKEQIEQDNMDGSIAPITINKFNDYISALYNYTLESLNRAKLTENDRKRTLSISSKRGQSQNKTIKQRTKTNPNKKRATTRIKLFLLNYNQNQAYEKNNSFTSTFQNYHSFGSPQPIPLS